MILEIFKVPYVNVPVLSNTIVSIFSAFSIILLFFTNIPLLAHRPSATTIASGVARPKLQGQATTKIVTKTIKLLEKLYPNIKYIIKVRIAIIITDGTK